MSVHWQDNSYYRALKDYEKETGMSLADRNALANPNGSHSTWGVLGVSLFTGVTNFAINKLGSGLGGNDTGSKTDVKSYKDIMGEWGSIKYKYDNALKSGNQEDVGKYYKELKSFYDNNNENCPTLKGLFATVETQQKNSNTKRVCF